MKIFKWIIRNEWDEKIRDKIIKNSCLIDINQSITDEIVKIWDKIMKESNENKKEQLFLYLDGLQRTSDIIINNISTVFPIECKIKEK